MVPNYEYTITKLGLTNWQKNYIQYIIGTKLQSKSSLHKWMAALIHLASATYWNLRFNDSNLSDRRGFLNASHVSRMLPLLSFHCNLCARARANPSWGWNFPVLCETKYVWSLRAFLWFIHPYTKQSEPSNKLYSGKNAVQVIRLSKIFYFFRLPK